LTIVTFPSAMIPHGDAVVQMACN